MVKLEYRSRLSAETANRSRGAAWGSQPMGTRYRRFGPLVPMNRPPLASMTRREPMFVSSQDPTVAGRR
jgi:hypothetical protein